MPQFYSVGTTPQENTAIDDTLRDLFASANQKPECHTFRNVRALEATLMRRETDPQIYIITDSQVPYADRRKVAKFIQQSKHDAQICYLSGVIGEYAREDRVHYAPRNVGDLKQAIIVAANLTISGPDPESSDIPLARVLKKTKSVSNVE